MIGEMLNGLVDTEKLTHDTIQTALEELAIEMKCSHTEFFIMIKPVNDKFNMKFYVYRLMNGVPKIVREITLREILALDTEE